LPFKLFVEREFFGKIGLEPTTAQQIVESPQKLSHHRP
jgi:hypothetical protein